MHQVNLTDVERPRLDNSARWQVTFENIAPVRRNFNDNEDHGDEDREHLFGTCQGAMLKGDTSGDAPKLQ